MSRKNTARLTRIIERNSINSREISIASQLSLEIIVDGPDGTGKTTLNSLIYGQLITEADTKIVDEADNDPFAQARSEYKKSNSTDPLVLLMSKCAGRLESIRRTKRELEEKMIRLHERGYGTTAAEYLASTIGNGYSQPKACIKFDEFKAVFDRMKKTYLIPDLHLILDCEPNTASERIASRYREKNVRTTDSESPLSIRTVRGYFLAIADLIPNVYIINTTEKTKDEVAKEAIELINELESNSNSFILV